MEREITAILAICAVICVLLIAILVVCSCIAIDVSEIVSTVKKANKEKKDPKHTFMCICIKGPDVKCWFTVGKAYLCIDWFMKDNQEYKWDLRNMCDGEKKQFAISDYEFCIL